jgi:hypothetical protein
MFGLVNLAGGAGRVESLSHSSASAWQRSDSDSFFEAKEDVEEVRTCVDFGPFAGR